jgi:tRNA threonylcarbamoyladenosine biosynthesis protein TsaE
VNEYPTDEGTLVHADLYRLEPEDAENLGLEDYLEGPEPCVLLVEWPERWESQPDSEALKIAIEATGETSRVFEVSSLGTKADEAARGLREYFERQDESLADMK